MTSIISCSVKNVRDNGLYTDYIKMNRFEVLDTLKLESMITKSKEEHKRLMGYTATCFYISQCGVKKEYNIRSESIYDGIDPQTLPLSYGFAYFHGSVFLFLKCAFQKRCLKKRKKNLM